MSLVHAVSMQALYERDAVICSRCLRVLEYLRMVCVHAAKTGIFRKKTLARHQSREWNIVLCLADWYRVCGPVPQIPCSDRCGLSALLQRENVFPLSPADGHD